MKKFILLLSLLALPFAFTSCGGDDDNGTPIGKALSDPEFKDMAAQYFQIKASDQPDAQKKQQLQELADQIILKFGEDGKVWVYTQNKKLQDLKEAEACDDPRPESQAPKVRGLKNQPNQWYVYVGEYTDGGEKGYVIGGKVNVKIDGNNITLSVGNQTIQNLLAQVQQSPLTALDIVNKACRTWVIQQTEVRVSGGDLKDTFGKFYQGTKARDLTYIAQSIDQEEDLQSVQMAKNLKENDRYTQIQTVSLSRTGAIEIKYANGKKDVGTITKLDAQGNISLMWNGVQLSNQYISGDLGITAKIQNNYLVLGFQSEVSVVDVPKPYNVLLNFVMEWAK